MKLFINNEKITGENFKQFKRNLCKTQKQFPKSIWQFSKNLITK